MRRRVGRPVRQRDREVRTGGDHVAVGVGQLQGDGAALVGGNGEFPSRPAKSQLHLLSVADDLVAMYSPADSPPNRATYAARMIKKHAVKTTKYTATSHRIRCRVVTRAGCRSTWSSQFWMRSAAASQAT